MKTYVLLLIMIVSVLGVFDIMQFGAIPHSDNVKDHFQNQKAFMAAIKAANESKVDRVIRIPDKTFYTMPFWLQNIDNIKIQILGRISASKNVRFWPRDQKNSHRNFIQINNCTNIEISGGGKIDGRGYHWWMILFLNDKKYLKTQNDRPHLINMVNCQNITIHDLVMKNSPQFHLKMDHCHDAELYNINIKVNTTAQLNLLKRLSLEGVLIMFPFNTDGIDPSGARMKIYNLTVQNYDDVVVPKPSHDDDCTRDMLVENCDVILGVGMSIGSVPPHQGGSCIRNITFRNVNMKRPFKGIYVKTNPGDKGWGNVTDIYYKNFTMDRPIWWAIYIGPQQMKQPDGDGPGCMLYPFDKKGTCNTQPRVTLKNITLQNISIHKSLLYPVTIRCNVTNPCTEINFINVHTDEWVIGQKQRGYVCEFASGRGIRNNPAIHCLNDPGSDIYTSQPTMTQIDLPFSSSSQQQNELQSSLIQYFQQLKSKGIHQLYKQMVLLSKSHYNKKKYLLSKVIEEVQKAVYEVGYEDEDEDEFSYDMREIQEQFADMRTVEEVMM